MDDLTQYRLIGRVIVDSASIGIINPIYAGSTQRPMGEYDGMFDDCGFRTFTYLGDGSYHVYGEFLPGCDSPLRLIVDIEDSCEDDDCAVCNG